MRLPIAVAGSSLSLVCTLLPGGAAHADTRYHDTGADVRLLQARLKGLGYTPGPINGRYDKDTRAAVWAFQKVNGIRPSTRVNLRTRTALWRPRRVRALVRGVPGRRVEINLRRQVLVMWQGRRPVLISHISTGANKYYCEHGLCGFARTPVGNFRVTRRIKGWHVGRLGAMYSPAYFVGGVALHGSTQVPDRPASHGCVRIPMNAAKKVFRFARGGVPVYVR